MALIRVVLDSHHEDETATLFISALNFHLKAAMPHHDFRIVCRETEKLCEVGAEMIASCDRALKEYREHAPHECLHLTPLELIGESGDTVAFIIVRVASPGIQYLNMLTFSATGISNELSGTLKQHVRHARSRYMKDRVSEQSAPYVHAVMEAYMHASDMLSKTAHAPQGVQAS